MFTSSYLNQKGLEQVTLDNVYTTTALDYIHSNPELANHIMELFHNELIKAINVEFNDEIQSKYNEVVLDDWHITVQQLKDKITG